MGSVIASLNQRVIQLTSNMYGWNCCKNMGSVIASFNQRIIQLTSNKYRWNCRNIATLDNKCLTANIVLKAVVSAPCKTD